MGSDGSLWLGPELVRGIHCFILPETDASACLTTARTGPFRYIYSEFSSFGISYIDPKTSHITDVQVQVDFMCSVSLFSYFGPASPELVSLEKNRCGTEISTTTEPWSSVVCDSSSEPRRHARSDAPGTRVFIGGVWSARGRRELILRYV